MDTAPNLSEPQPDDMLTTTELAKRIQWNGGACHSHRQTVNRWCKRGILVHGKRIKLVAELIGGRWGIRWRNWLSFKEQLTTRAGGEQPNVRTPAEERRAHNKALDGIEKILGKKVTSLCRRL